MTPEASLRSYWPGRWPGEDGGPRRTQAPPGGAGGFDLQPGEKLGVTSRPLMMSCMTILRDAGEVYVQGTAGAAATRETTGWVERIDPESLATTQRSSALPAGPYWPGGIAAHANGSLYVTCGRWCHRLAPDCQVIASRELPRDRPYNSLLILPSGIS